MNQSKCDLCPLHTTARTTCWPTDYGYTTPRVIVIATAPGREEDEYGEPLVGASGEECRHQLDINGITAFGVRLDNICKCRPLDKKGENRDPHVEEIATCTKSHLIPSILIMQPTHIISMGAVATQFFIGDVNMEMVHGIPRTIDFHGMEVVLIPTYHPAHGLHSPANMILYHMDMRAAGDTIKGRMVPHPPADEFPEPEYKLATVEIMEEILNEVR